MFEDPTFDCTAEDFAAFMTDLVQAFAKDETENFGGDKDARSAWLGSFEEWLETAKGRQTCADHMKAWAQKNL